MKFSSHRVTNACEPSESEVRERMNQINTNHVLSRLTTNKLARIRKEPGAASVSVLERVIEKEAQRRGPLVGRRAEMKEERHGRMRLLSKTGRSMVG